MARAVYPVAGSLTITTPITRQARQINGSNQADIPITGTRPSGESVEASFNGGAYATIQTGAGTSISGTLSAQAAGQGTLTIRLVNYPAVTATVTLITLTDVFMVGGDSISEGRFTNRATDSGTAKGVCFTQNDAWISTDESGTGVSCDPGATNGTIVPILASQYYALKGRPAAFITAGTGSTDVGPTTGTHKEWTKGQSGYTEMDAQIVAAATAGIKGGIFTFGPNALADIPSQAAYNTSIDTFLSDFKTDYTTAQSADPKAIIVIHGECGTTGLSAANLRLAEDQVRGAILLALSDNVQLGATWFDPSTNYTDDVHPATDAERNRYCRRAWMAAENTWFSGTYGRGPRISAATINAALTTITLTTDIDLASDTTYGGFRVEDSGTPATLTSVTQTAVRTIVIVLSAPASAVANVVVKFGSADDAVGQTIPTSAAKTLPDSNTEVLPMENFYAQAVTLAATLPKGSHSLLGVGY